MSEKKGYNPRSKDNLRQFSQLKLDAREKKLRTKLSKELGMEKDIIEAIAPTAKIFTEEEQDRFMASLTLYIREFSEEGDLTISDYDDICTLCKNNILVDRLLAASRSGTDAAEVTNAIDKYRRSNEVIKKQLAATRDKRIDPKTFTTITILDIIAQYESQTKNIDDELRKLAEEEATEVDPTKYKTTVSDMLT